MVRRMLLHLLKELKETTPDGIGGDEVAIWDRMDWIQFSKWCKKTYGYKAKQPQDFPREYLIEYLIENLV